MPIKWAKFENDERFPNAGPRSLKTKAMEKLI